MIRRCVWFLAVMIFGFGGTKCETPEYDWNGCIGEIQRDFAEGHFCFEIKAGMDGVSAWKSCSSLNFQRDFRNASVGEAFITALREVIKGGERIWIGGIEVYPGADSFLAFHGIVPKPDSYEGEGRRGCLALDPTKEFKIIRMDCETSLPMLCIYPKFEAVLFNAESPTACNFTKAVAMPPIEGCFIQQNGCPFSSFKLRPKPGTEHMKSSLEYIEKGLPIPVQITAMDTLEGVFKNKDAEGSDAEEFCLTPHDGHGMLRLELRYNQTAKALTLWVGSPGRGLWPPRCVGGSVDPRGDPRALRIVPDPPLDSTETWPVLWCYTKDIIVGEIAMSNSVTRLPKNDFCPDTDSIYGPPHGTTIDERASCLRCIKEVISPCERNVDCKLDCNDTDGCGHFKITLDEWNKLFTKLKREAGYEGLKKCAMDEVCGGEAFWELTNGNDCNGDGVFDCDDRLKKIFNPECKAEGDDPRESLDYGPKYWQCRTNSKTDFVDLPHKNGTARYYCETALNGARYWDYPEYLDEITPYLLSSTSRPLAPQQVSDMLKKLFVLSNKNTTMSEEEIRNVVINVSKLMDVDEHELQKAKREANVSSLAERLEAILVHAPDNVNLTTANIAVSKGRARGFHLLSANPSSKTDAFGISPWQISIRNANEINKFKSLTETAVIVPDLPDSFSLVVVIFPKNDDFIPCRSQLNKERNSSIGISANNAAPSEPMDNPREFCSQGEEIMRGCINTHIIQVNIIGQNESYEKLPQGNHVDIILRLKRAAAIGEIERCVYWHPEKKVWASDGCELLGESDGLATCRCTHLTHFAQLVTDGAAVTGPHAPVLRVVTACACALSLLAMTGVLVAGICASKWRQKLENKVMLNLAVAMVSYMSLFLWSALTPKPPLNTGRCVAEEKLDVLCQGRGAALHYFVLSSFCWMLVAAITHHLRFTTLTGPAGVPHFVLKAALLGWGAPAVPVAVLMGVDATTYAGRGRDFCYPTGAAFYGAVLAPILAVLIGNVAIFALIVRRLFPALCASPDGTFVLRRSGNQKREQMRKLIVCVAFTFLFGLTWYLGLMSFTVVPAYIFCAVVALQGPALFVIFVLGEESVRKKLQSFRKTIRKKVKDHTSESIGSTDVSISHSSTSRPDRKPSSPKSRKGATGSKSDVEDIPL